MRIVEREMTAAEMAALACEKCGNCGGGNCESCSEQCCEGAGPPVVADSTPLARLDQLAVEK